MCRWMGSHFHDWIDFYGVAFSIELLEWDRASLNEDSSLYNGKQTYQTVL